MARDLNHKNILMKKVSAGSVDILYPQTKISNLLDESGNEFDEVISSDDVEQWRKVCEQKPFF